MYSRTKVDIAVALLAIGLTVSALADGETGIVPPIYPVIEEVCTEKVNVFIETEGMGWVIKRICAEQIETPTEVTDPEDQAV